jgi:hypothetical protein
MKPHAIGKKMIMDHFFFYPSSDINFSQITFVIQLNYKKGLTLSIIRIHYQIATVSFQHLHVYKFQP